MKRAVRLFAVMLVCVMTLASYPVVQAAETAPKIVIASAALSLEDNIYLYFDVIGEGFDKEKDSYGMIFWNGLQPDKGYTLENATSLNSVVYGRAEWKYDSDLGRDACRYSYAISAKEMTDLVYAQAYVTVGNITYYSGVVPYSAHTYAARKLGYVTGVNATSDQSLKELLVGMVGYGALSQKHFDYKNDVPANQFMAENHSHSVSLWSIVSENEASIKKVGVCSSCGLAQSVTESKSNEPVEAELTYSELDGDVYVTGISGDYTGKQVIINIPEDKNVSYIADSAFQNMTNIISVTLPSTLLGIEGNAFAGCTAITEISLPENLSTIQFGAFSGCTSLESVTFMSDSGWTVYNLETYEFDSVDVSDIYLNAELVSSTYANTLWTKSE